MRFHIASASTLITDPAALPMIVQACDLQILNDASPAWDQYGNVFFAETVDAIPKDIGVVPIVVYDDADQAGALGWHTEELGVFFGRIFVRPVLDNGGDLYSNPALSLSSVISHEVLETLVDPTVSDWSQRVDGALVAKEVGDPVEGDAYPITVLGKSIMVSNFVLPAWFDAQNTTGPFDKMGKLTAPFTMTPGGYIVTMAAGPTTEEGARQAGRQQARAATGRSGKRRSSGRPSWA